TTCAHEAPRAARRDEPAAASVALGVFGTGRKAAMVVPNKVYQAAAAGRPLVTRDGPGLREVLEPGTHCLVCPPGDPAALAAAVGELLAAPTRAERLGAAARNPALSRLRGGAVAAPPADVLAARLGVRADAGAPGLATGA